jgi:predicted nucleic acid-binding protein
VDRPFLDANILFSAAYKADAMLARLWQLPSVQLVTSPYAIEEARRNLQTDEQRMRLDTLLAAVTIVLHMSDHPAAATAGLPEKDVPILAAAIAAQATHLLTGDVKHFRPLFGTSIQGVLVQRPGDDLRGKETTP